MDMPVVEVPGAGDILVGRGKAKGSLLELLKCGPRGAGDVELVQLSGNGLQWKVWHGMAKSQVAQHG